MITLFRNFEREGQILIASCLDNHAVGCAIALGERSRCQVDRAAILDDRDCTFTGSRVRLFVHRHRRDCLQICRKLLIRDCT